MNDSESEDKMLMVKLASGDTPALDKLYQKHWRTIDAFVRSRLSEVSDTDASDIVQNVFLRIQQKAHLYKPSGRVLSWMRKIAQNLITDMLRQHLSRCRRDTNYALARPPQGGEVEGPDAIEWEIGDLPSAPGGLYGEDIPDYRNCEQLYGMVAPCDYVIVPRSSGGDIWVWQGNFPMRRARWRKRDRMRDFMQGHGRDDVPGMFSYYGLAPLKNKKSCT